MSGHVSVVFSLFVSLVHQSTSFEKANEKAKKVQTQIISLWSQVRCV